MCKKEIKDSVVAVLLEVMKDPKSKPSDRIRAATILMKYSSVSQ